MKSIASYIFPVILVLLGGILLIYGAIDGQNAWVLLGSFLALLTGAIALLLQAGIVGPKVGMAIGIACALTALFLTYRNYRSIAEELEFQERKAHYNDMVVQGLKDMREAQKGYRTVTGVYTGNLEVLREFVKHGTIPMVRAIGQVPDSLTELQALELKIIVRDTIQAPALDSLFRTTKAMEGRMFPFNPDSLTFSPVSKKPFILRAGSINSSGRNAPVFLVKDPAPLAAGDTLMVGSMEKVSIAGNWKGD